MDFVSNGINHVDIHTHTYLCNICVPPNVCMIHDTINVHIPCNMCMIHDIINVHRMDFVSHGINHVDINFGNSELPSADDVCVCVIYFYIFLYLYLHIYIYTCMCLCVCDIYIYPCIHELPSADDVRIRV